MPGALAREHPEGDAAVPDHGQVEAERARLEDRDLTDLGQARDLEDPPLAELVGQQDAGGDRQAEAQARLAGWIADGTISYREEIIDGFDQLPTAFIGLFNHENFGRRLVRILVSPAAAGIPAAFAAVLVALARTGYVSARLGDAKPRRAVLRTMFGGALAMGIAVGKSSEAMARQPEATSQIRTTMMMGLVFIETVIIYALIVAILIIFVL